MKYYLHDTSAFLDEKITELYINFGYEGIGLFYTTLEKIALQEKPIKTDVLKHQLKVGKKLEKCWDFMEQIGLISSNNGETFNEQLLNYSEKYQIKKIKNKEKVSKWRENQKNKESVTGYVPVSNLPKVKESKVKESKVKGDDSLNDNEEIKFEYFFNLYHEITKLKRTDKSAALKYWDKLNKIEKSKAVENIQLYYDALNDKKYCKKARTYLSDKNFDDEFPVYIPNQIPLQKHTGATVIQLP